MSDLTLDDVRALTRRGIMFLDGTTDDGAHTYQNHYQCVEYPQLVIVKRGPPHSVHYYCDGVEIERTAEAIRDALNASIRSANKEAARDE